MAQKRAQIGFPETRRPSEVLGAWRELHWPPPLRQPFVPLPLYVGSATAVAQWAQPLMEAMQAVAGHVTELANGGRPPRWMRVPKLRFDVLRIGVVHATAKASRSFESIEKLQLRCGSLGADETRAVAQWMEANPGRGLVAHSSRFEDIRAHVWTAGSSAVEQVHFYQAGLVVAIAPRVDLVLQDHRDTVRRGRADAYQDPLAITSQGWSVFGARPRRRRNASSSVKTPAK